jgi:CBS domain-containing protein
MAEHQVRRLPVVDGDDRVVGVLSLCDVVRAGRAGLEPTAVVDTLAAIVTPRTETRSTKSTQPTVQLQPKPSRARAAKKSTKKKSTKGTTKKAARTSRKR